MRPIAFIGGVITGVAALAAAAYFDDKKTEAKYSPELKQPQGLDAGAICKELNNYFFMAQKIYAKCNEIQLEGSDLIATPIELPWDTPLRKVANSIGGKLTEICRGSKFSKLLDCRNELYQLYDRYNGVFKRANVLAGDVLAIPDKLLVETGKKPDNSLANEEWDMELSEAVDNVRNAIEKSCDLAEQLIAMLEKQEPDAAKTAAAI